jgi:two-component system NarL family sensor kinase
MRRLSHLRAVLVRLVLQLATGGAFGFVTGMPVTAGVPAPPDSAQLRSILFRADALSLSEPDSARILAFKALHLAQTSDLAWGKAEASALLGLLNFHQNQPDSAEAYYRAAYRLWAECGSLEGRASSVASLSLVALRKGDPEKALRLLLAELSRQEKKPDTGAFAHLNMGLGTLYEHLKEYPKALAHFHRALKLSVRAKDKLHGKIMNGLGNTYYQLDSLKKAHYYYQRALEFYTREGDIRALAGINNNLGGLHQKTNSPNALARFQRSLVQYRKLKDKRNQASVLNNIGWELERKGELQKAESTFLEAYALSKSLADKEQIRDIAGSLYLLYKDLGKNDRALGFLEEYHELTDSLLTETRVKAIAQMEEKYHSDVRAREIALLKKQNQLKEANEARSKLERNASIGLAVLVLVLAVLGLRFYRQRQRLAEKNGELNRKQVLDLMQQRELTALHAHLEGQETERRRIAQDLHDRLGGLLATIKLYFQMARTPEQHQKTNELLDSACQEVRQIAHDMVSGVLMKFGLVAALQNLADSITGSGQVKMHTYFNGLDNRLESKVEIILYRIVQELVNNALRHGRATEITLQLTRHEHSLVLMVEDNGIGFIEKESTPGMGLEGIRERVQQLHGSFEIDSSKGRGTIMIVEVPLGVEQQTGTYAEIEKAVNKH